MKLFKAITKPFRDDSPTTHRANNDEAAAGPSRLNRAGTSRQTSDDSNTGVIQASHALLLKQLKVGREADHDLITIPVMDGLGGGEPAIAADPMTAQLSGLAYIQYLASDDRLLATFKSLVTNKLLPAATRQPDAARAHMVKKLRLIAAEAYRDRDLAMRLEHIALDYIGYCGDRAEYILSQLHGEALLANLRRGELDDVSLYNIGISFFRLATLHQEAIKRKPDIFNAAQSVHEFYELEYRLQDRLKLPFKHDPQMFPGNSRHVTPAFTEEVATAVQQRCCVNDGEEAIAFMARWEPWTALVRNDRKNMTDLEHLSNTFQGLLEAYETNRLDPTKAEYHLTEQNVLDFMNNVMRRREEWNREYVGQKAREFLVNHRACIVLDEGLSSTYLNH